MKKKVIFFIIVLVSVGGISQNVIELRPSDCNGTENGYPEFLLSWAEPKILTDQVFGHIEKYETHDLRIIINNSDTLKIQYRNIFGQTTDTTYYNAKELNNIEICGNQFIDYEKKSLIKEAIKHNQNWILNSIWGHGAIEYDKLVLIPKKNSLKYKYYKNGKRIKTGVLKLTETTINEISLFERKLNSMKNADNGCNFSHGYQLTNGIETIELQDNSCSGFSHEILLKELKIIE